MTDATPTEHPPARVFPRPMREGDEAFVIDTWRNTWRLSNEARRETPRGYHAIFEDLVIRGVLADPDSRVLVIAVESDPNEIAGWISYAPGTIPTVHYAFVRKFTKSTRQPLRRAGLLGAMVHLAGVRDRLVYTFRPSERTHPKDNRTLGIERALLDAAKRKGITAIHRSALDYLGRRSERT